MHNKLQHIFEAFDRWCAKRDIPYDIQIDEDDLQSFLVFKRHASYLPRLTKFIKPLAMAEGVHIRQLPVRSGTIFAFSLEALREDQLVSLIGTPFARTIDDVFAENQYNWSGSNWKRNQTKVSGINRTYGADENVDDDPSVDEPVPGFIPQRRGMIDLPTRRHRRRRQLHKKSEFTMPPNRTVGEVPAVREDLGGLAAHHQPQDMLKNLDAAMRKMGLHAALSTAKITNKLSDDRQRIIFMVKDANGASRPIAAYDLVKLGEGNNLYDALSHLMDLANQKAPGEGELELEKIKEREQALRQIAKQHTPQADAEANSPQMMPAVESFDKQIEAAFA